MLTMPRLMSRQPHSDESNSFGLVEYDQHALPWMNSGYAMLARIAATIAQTNWCTDFAGKETGVVDGLPAAACETAIEAEDAAAIGRLGFQSLYGDETLAFPAAAQCQSPPKFQRPQATADASLAAQLPAVLATCRILHHAIALIASQENASRTDVEKRLNDWIANQCRDDDEGRVRPLTAAGFSLKDIPDSPEWWRLEASLQPKLPRDQLNSPLRLAIPVLRP
jgi:type VI secretion system protein ImpC